MNKPMWVALGLVAVVVFAAAGLAYFMDGGSADSQQAEALSNPRAWRNRPRSRAMSQSVPEQIRRSAPPPHATALLQRRLRLGSAQTRAAPAGARRKRQGCVRFRLRALYFFAPYSLIARGPRRLRHGDGRWHGAAASRTRSQTTATTFKQNW